MTQPYPRNLARHLILARQGGGRGKGNNVGNGSDNGGLLGILPTASPTATDSSTSSTPTSAPPEPESSSPPPPSPPPPSSTSIPSSTSSVQSTTPPPPPPVVKTSTSTSSSVPTSKSSSTTTTTTISTSSRTSSTARSTSSTPKPTTTSTLVNPVVNSNQFTSTSSFIDAALTDTGSAGPTTSAVAKTASTSSDLSAGSIVGIVVGTLIGLAFLVSLIAFLLRRYRQSQRRAMRDSDFGTFRRSAFVTPRSAAPTPPMLDMAETDHNIAPSLNEPYVPYPATAAQPPSQALAASTAAAVAATTVATGSGLQERPKYVYGQDPSLAYQQQLYDDVASDLADGGAYSSQPQVQSAYNAEAYGSYAKYEDVGNGVVGGVPAGTAMYQDAQRAYQGQQGYDQTHYDQSHYTGYSQQQQQQFQQTYAAGSSRAAASAHIDAYGGI